MDLNGKKKIYLAISPCCALQILPPQVFLSFLHPDSPMLTGGVEDIKFLLIPIQEVQEEGVTL